MNIAKEFKETISHVWIQGYEGHYSVDNRGNIYSHKKKLKHLMPIKNTNGYHQVQLYKDGKGVKVSIHKLVAYAFCFKSLGATEIDHLNSIRTDNNADNLEFVSAQVNIERSHAKSFSLVSPEGYLTNGNNRAKFCRENGLDQSCVGRLISGKQELHKGWSVFKRINKSVI